MSFPEAPAKGSVLMLVSAFPPGQQIVFRTLKFAKYLPEFGWQPFVLSCRQAQSPVTVVEQIPPGTRVEATGRVPTPSMLVRRIRRRLQRSAVEPAAVPASASGTREDSGTLNTALRSILLWGDTPDEFVGWLPPALFRGWRLLRALRAPVLYASGPPFSVVLVGVLLARLTKRPMIADFRDAWTLDNDDPFGTVGGTFRNAPNSLRSKVLRRLERLTVTASHRVLFTSRATERAYLEAYPNLAGRTVVVFNGVDPDDFVSPPQFGEVPRATHVGTIHEYQVPQVLSLLEAVAAGRRTGALPPLSLDLVGPISPPVVSCIAAAVERLGLAQLVRFHGTVPHGDSIDWVRGADVLLLFCGDNPFIRLSKISEYAASRRPMLAFALPSGETALEVRALGGKVVAGDDPSATIAALQELLRLGVETRTGDLSFPFPHPHPLNRRTEASQLASLLEDLTAAEAS